MRWANLYIAGLGCYLPEEVQMADYAVAAGQYDAKERAANGIHAVRVASESETGPVMAASAGRQALARSGHGGDDISLVLHACYGHQGQEFWTPVNYIQREIGAGSGISIEIKQGCNGGLAALELAASHLAARPEGAAAAGPGQFSAALVTTGDAFRLPYFDRWASDGQQVYGDGAGALVLSSRHGFARLLSTASLSDSSLEPIYRGTNGWTEAPFAEGKPVDLASRKAAYLLQNEDRYEKVIGQMVTCASATLQRALDDAGTTLDAARFFVHANISETVVNMSFYNLMGVRRERTTYDWGQYLGHMGAGDQIIGMNHIAESGAPRPGDLLVTMGVGVGFMWTAAVMEFLDTPAW